MTKATDAILGSNEQCQNCGHTVTCGMSKPTGGYAPKQQWQNPSGSAHYHTNGTIFKCHLDDGTIVGPKGVIEQQAGQPAPAGQATLPAGSASEALKAPTATDSVNTVRMKSCIDMHNSCWTQAVYEAKKALRLPENASLEGNLDLRILSSTFYKGMTDVWVSI